MDRTEVTALVKKYITDESLFNHCQMVAAAMEAYAKALQLPEVEVEEWWQAGMVHDIDWQQYPDEHPKHAIENILPAHFSQAVIDAVAAHAPQRTGRQPQKKMEKYLFACDELSGFMNAVSLMRPNGFADMKVKSVKKKLKDKKFAAGVSRDDIKRGAELIDEELSQHIDFLISVFRRN